MLPDHPSRTLVDIPLRHWYAVSTNHERGFSIFKNNFTKRTATKAQVERRAKKLGVEVDDETDNQYVQIFLYTPKGLRFKATGCHTAATSFSRLQPGDRPNSYEGTKADGWGYAMEDLEYGTEECDNPNCGYCERGLMNE